MPTVDFAGQSFLSVIGNRVLTPDPLLPNVFIESFGMSFTGDGSRGIQMSYRSDGSTALLEDNNMLFRANNGVGFFVPVNSGTTTYTINRNTVNHANLVFVALPERFFDVRTRSSTP